MKKKAKKRIRRKPRKRVKRLTALASKYKVKKGLSNSNNN